MKVYIVGDIYQYDGAIMIEAVYANLSDAEKLRDELIAERVQSWKVSVDDASRWFIIRTENVV